VDHFAKWRRAGILELCRELKRRLRVSSHSSYCLFKRMSS
jgi:hypothetical protein